MLAPDFAKKTARLDDDMVGYFYAHLQKCVKSGNLAVVNVTSTGVNVILTTALLVQFVDKQPSPQSFSQQYAQKCHMRRIFEKVVHRRLDGK